MERRAFPLYGGWSQNFVLLLAYAAKEGGAKRRMRVILKITSSVSYTLDSFPSRGSLLLAVNYTAKQ